MGAIDRFATTLTSTGHDDFVTILQSMSDGMYLSRSKEIESELSRLVARIDEVNQQRAKMSTQRALLERLLKKVDGYLAKSDSDLEMELFRLHLSNHLDRLRVRIAETRPDDELKRKHDLTRERMLIDAGKKIAIEVLGRIAKSDVAETR